MNESKEFIKSIVLNGSSAEKRELYSFTSTDSIERILKKFKYFARGNYPRYFEFKSPAVHDDMARDMIKSYLGLINFANIASRGLAKTALAKLFMVFVLLNDKSIFRRYLKVLTLDGKNSKQIVTDIYNLIIELQEVYGDVFEKEGKAKHEETMASFTLSKGVKLTAGTVGQTQRGHIQDAYRPDWIWFDDVEDVSSITSMTITQNIVNKISEAINGLAKGGTYLLTANYISDQGVVEWMKEKPSVTVLVTPIADNDFNPTWPERDTRQDILQIKADADNFWPEYMCDPSKAENKFFDIARIKADMEKATGPIRESAGIKYWGNYLPHHRYGQGSDHSDGVGLDSNTLAGFDFTTGELIYTYANNQISPDMAVHEFARVGSEYGNCLYAPEINNKCGGIVITTLKSIGYSNIFSPIKDDKRLDKRTDRLGWETNSKTKRNMFFEFKRDYNDGLIIIKDMDVLKEMKAYSNSDLQETTAGLITRHFDLLTAVVIAWQMNKHATNSTPIQINFDRDRNGVPSFKRPAQSMFAR